MNSIKVLRIENISGFGIFWSRPSFAYSICSTVGDRHVNFPIPYEDKNVVDGYGLNLYQDSKQWFCAYKTVDQLKQWITVEECRELTQHGFAVYLLEVEEYQEGEYQVIFTKESIISKQDVTELFI